MTLDPPTLLLIGLTFFLAGAVKGVIGLGLPTVSLGLLTAAIDLPTAMALLIVPSLVTNIVQASVGGNRLRLLKRLWPFLLMATGTVWIGTLALNYFDLNLLSTLLGLLLISYAAISLGGVRISLSPRQEAWSAPVFGIANGILTGMTGSFVVPGVLYLQAIGLPRDQLIQAMGMLFTAATLSLGIALQSNGIMTSTLGLASLLSLIPALFGMILGQRLRKRLPEPLFRQVFFGAVLILGVFIVGRALV